MIPTALHTLRIATRKSRMALAQAAMVAKKLKAAHKNLAVEIVEIVSDGCYEKFQGDIAALGGKGAFIKALQVSLLQNDADIAVHCVKDIPGDVELPDGLYIPAVLKRDDMRDVVVCRKGASFVELKSGARIGTSSPRRMAQLHSAFPGFRILPIRGNVDTRLKKLDDGEYDAIVVSKSGLERLGEHARISEVFEPDMMCPAIGQGAIGVECRTGDKTTQALIECLNDGESFTCFQAERALLNELGGHCHSPIAGYCEVTKGGNLRMIALVASPDGSKVVRARQKMPYDDPEALGKTVAQELLAQGADKLIEECAA